ncbi:MAG TPA: DUF4340 domain-containing protein, partial [Tepidisphaeraceae bacterium]|nr:DUF4340 domain-containing protein [Tepidisphaeraceae bacterium]
MNFRTTLVMLALVVVVGLTLLIVNRSHNDSSTDTSTANQLITFDPATVTNVTVTAADAKRLVLERTGAAWRMVEPVSAPADAFAVDNLVRALANIQSRGQVKLTGNDASAAGLDQPRYQAELRDAAGKTVAVKVGNRMTIGDNVYLQLASDKTVHVVSGELYDQLDKPFTTYRQRKLVAASASDIKQIEITRPDSKLILQKTGSDWQIVAPTTMPAESSAISELAFSLTSLNATEFVSDADAARLPELLLPNQNPQLTVWFSTQAPSTQPTTQPAGTTLRFGGYDSVLKKNVYASLSDSPALAKVPAASMEAFKKNPLDLRNRTIVRINPAQVSRISLVTDQPATTQPTTQPASHTELVLERKKQPLALGPDQPTTRPATAPATNPALPQTDWVLKSANGADASQRDVKALLKRFQLLRATKYLPGPLPTNPSAAQYTLQITVQTAGSPA